MEVGAAGGIAVARVPLLERRPAHVRRDVAVRVLVGVARARFPGAGPRATGALPALELRGAEEAAHARGAELQRRRGRTDGGVTVVLQARSRTMDSVHSPSVVQRSPAAGALQTGGRKAWLQTRPSAHTALRPQAWPSVRRATHTFGPPHPIWQNSPSPQSSCWRHS